MGIYSIHGGAAWSSLPQPDPHTAGKSKRQQKRKGGGGFGVTPTGSDRMMSLTRVPPDTEVLFVVAPSVGQLTVVQNFCESVGMDRLVILLNARSLDDGQQAASVPECSFFDDEFVHVAAFATNPVQLHEGQASIGDEPMMLWRSFPEDWVLARKPSFGPPVVVLTSEERPTIAAMQAAIDKGGDSNIMEAIGGMFGGGRS